MMTNDELADLKMEIFLDALEDHKRTRADGEAIDGETLRETFYRLAAEGLPQEAEKVGNQ